MNIAIAEKTNVHSNAFNFASFVESGIDSRTGLYTVGLSLHDVEVNELRGPTVLCHLRYNPASAFNYGYGAGWRLALTQYSPATQIIATSEGESFKVTGTFASDGEPDRLKMKEQKIQSFKLYKLTGDPRGDFKVVYRSGLVEILKLTGASPQEAVPVKMYSAQGHEVTLAYQSAGQGRMLSTISDSQGLLVQVVRNLTASTLEINLKPVQGVALATFTLHLEGEWMTRISLPTANGAGWRFLYGLERDQLCIKEVWTPFGAHETIQYNDGGHGIPGTGNYLNLPRVTDHRTDPGGGREAIVRKFTYSDNGNNFLGRNASISWDEDGLDNLYKVTGLYQYETTESLIVASVPVQTVTRTFNRFHLLTRQVTTQGTHQQSVTTTYYANDTDPFDRQELRFQLPRKVDTRWELTDDPRQYREDTELTEYDHHGNLTLSRKANGVTETTAWYPADGVSGDCPADPYGFVRHMQEKTVTPAADLTLVPDLQPGAPVLRTRYRYVEQRAITGSPATTPWVAVAEERLLEVAGQTETLLEKLVNTYIDNPGNALTHGLIEQTAVTLGAAPGYTTFTDYAYSKPAATYATFAGETVLRTVQTLSTDFDSVSKVITEERSLFSGLPVLATDKDVKIRTTYDVLGRALTETVAPDSTAHAATRTYSYRLIRPAGQGQTPETQPASQVVEDVKGVKTRTVFDGIARPILEEREDVDNAGSNPPAYRTTYAAAFNALGQLTRETEIDWLEKKDLPLATTFTYDDWGQENSVTGPDAVKTHTTYNPITFQLEEWIEGRGKTVTLNNRFDKPVSVERKDLSNARISLHSYKYDGLARTASEKNAGGFETLYAYDAFDRMVETTLPDRAKVVREYAPHSRDDLPTRISVNNKLLGTQAFDGAGRMIESVTGGRITTYAFNSSDSQPSRVTRPSGDIAEYTYKLELTDEPVTRTSTPKVATLAPIQATYAYDPRNARLLESSEQGLTLHRTYNSNGEVATEKRDSYEMTYVHSRMGRLVRYTDVLGQIQGYEYDDKGRLTSTELGSLGTPGHIKSSFTYDSQGLTESISTEDTTAKQSLTIDLAYDSHGREILRVFDFGAAAQRLSQTWNGLDQVESRLLSDGSAAGGAVLRHEKYEYERRGRLEFYSTEGPQSPVDPAGKVIKEQLFFFDAIDNIEEVSTTFATGNNIAKYVFDREDPAQLGSVSNSHADYKLFDTVFSYDDNGNLLQDAQWTMGYDSLGRLATVSGASGGSSKSYGYDGEDTLSRVSGDGSDEHIFYRGDEPANRIDGDQQNTFVFGNGVALAERQAGADPKS
ncbi:RHS repeat domain-containing protein [Pseudomonas sp. GB2N2]